MSEDYHAKPLNGCQRERSCHRWTTNEHKPDPQVGNLTGGRQLYTLFTQMPAFKLCAHMHGWSLWASSLWRAPSGLSRAPQGGPEPTPGEP
eukprot:3739394-Pyramimonas_sp.AAC.1